MIFWLDGQEWNTDKSVFIVGYIIAQSWVPVSKKRKDDIRGPQDYGLVCRKEFISQIEVEHESGRSWVRNFTTTSKDHRTIKYSDCIITTSLQKAKEMYRKAFEEYEENRRKVK